MINVEGIRDRVRRAVEARDTHFLRRLERALKPGPALRKSAPVGFTLAVLWEAGLKRLTYRQIRGFLKAAGFHGVPSPGGLERYAQRLGLKKYWTDQPRGVGEVAKTLRVKNHSERDGPDR